VAHDLEIQTAGAENDVRTLPVLVVPGIVLLPHMLIGLKVTDKYGIQALKAAEAFDNQLVLAPSVVQADDDDDDDSDAESLQAYDDEGRPLISGQIGVVATIEHNVANAGGRQIAIIGRFRFVISDLQVVDGVAYVRGKDNKDSEELDADAEHLHMLRQKCLALFEHMAGIIPSRLEGVMSFLQDIEHIGHLADQTGYFPEYEFAERLEILRELDPVKRLEQVLQILKRHVAQLQLRADIMDEVKEELDQTQREVYLREQLRVVQRQLGDDENSWLEQWREQMAQIELPHEVRVKVEREARRLEHISVHAPEAAVIQSYLELVADLPWVQETKDTLDLHRAAEILDSEHYGLVKVKERILEYLAVRALAGHELKAPILCFVGPPGVGKTSLGRTIAHVMGRKFVRMSLGGISDVAEIRGHRRTYVGALPGRIIQGMRDVKVRNPVFMLDEIDKVSRTYHGDPTAALLEALDPEQNHAFSDHYLEVPFDLSHTLFITTANLLDPIPAALRDRLEVIPISGYTQDEKLAIAKQFLIPKQIRRHGLREEEVVWRDAAVVQVIRDYTHEAGVRTLEREIATVIRKIARRIVERGGDRSQQHVVRAGNIQSYLGPARYEYGQREVNDQVGVATGVAVTEAGGEILPIEVAVVAGSGKLLLTGQLGPVMQESAQAALTYARAAASELGAPAVKLDDHDIHIHVPAGGVPKDGPSAGVAIATALLSALTGRVVRNDVAMTGEVTLRGRVLPIGGLKEKVLAVKSAGIAKFLLPRRNRKDLLELAKEVRRGIELIPVDHMDEIIAMTLHDADEQPDTGTEKAAACD
jgi:ATP-dependent Lon protease